MALIIAVLYFGLIELMLYDAQRQLGEARRFRARVIALTLAENGAELAAWNLVNTPVSQAPITDWQGTMEGNATKAGTGFTINAAGQVTGIVNAHASVYVQGRIDESKPPLERIKIDYTRHTQ
jgi:hypothetical protein